VTDLERFVAVATGETPDYMPIFGFPGAPGMSGTSLSQVQRRRLSMHPKGFLR
jgi:hypothetical protein